MKIHIVADDGELLEQIDLTEYDMERPFARRLLAVEILEILDTGKGNNDYKRFYKKI